MPGTFGDPLAVIQNFAGVARPPPLSGLIIIRGSSPQDSQIFADGAEIPLIYHFGGLRTVLPVGVIDALDFYPGNFSSMYGRATGGVIDVRIKKLQPKKVGGYVDVNLFDAGGYLEVPLGDKGGVAIAARRSYIDALLKATVPSDAPVNLITAPRYYDYQLLGNYRPTPAHDFRRPADRLRRSAGAPVPQPGRADRAAQQQPALVLDHLLPIAHHVQLHPERRVRELVQGRAGARLDRPELRAAAVQPEHLPQPGPRHRAPQAGRAADADGRASTRCSPRPTCSSAPRCRPRKASRLGCPTCRTC